MPNGVLPYSGLKGWCCPLCHQSKTTYLLTALVMGKIHFTGRMVIVSPKRHCFLLLTTAGARVSWEDDTYSQFNYL